jgi:sugar-specific transcriptional regulator TrmB
MPIELLQAIGLNKYEAEAYTALFQHGPLTGYELGKRSGVPLSRSYEILERLTAKGLALVQPGDPPRYMAEAPEQFIERTRHATMATLDALATSLAELHRPQADDGFWVIRGSSAILTHVQTLIGKAERTVALTIAAPFAVELETSLEKARARGVQRILAPVHTRSQKNPAIFALVDGRAGLAGTLMPARECQALASTNPVLSALLGHFFTPQTRLPTARQPEASPPTSTARPLDWLDWEDRKQHRLLDVLSG